MSPPVTYFVLIFYQSRYLFTRKILHATIIKNRHQRRTPT
jgi:hypothetical protein